MGSVVLSCLALFSFSIMLPAVWADSCTAYWDDDGSHHDTEQCGFAYCCGNCNSKYCCYSITSRLTEESCTERPPRFAKQSGFAVLLGSIVGSVFPVMFCVGLIICCVAPCCLCYKKCRKGRNRQHQTVITYTVPQQPPPPPGYQPSSQGYLSVPGQPGYGDPSSAMAPPPSYMEATYSPVAFIDGHPMYPPHPTGPLHAPPPHSEFAQHPYNPSFSSNM